MIQACEPADDLGQRKVCGVVVTYHPDADLENNLQAIIAECGHVIVVDNGSGAHNRKRLLAIRGLELLELGSNLGLAAALNRGAERALVIGCEWMVAFDQDSCPREGMVAAMWRTHETLASAAVIGPQIQEVESKLSRYRWVRKHSRWPWLFQRVAAKETNLDDVTMIVTSGSLIELAVWRKLGGFDEDLFIDYIDTDYCLRVIRGGRRVAVAAKAVMNHRLGARRSEQWLGREFRPTHHAAFRHYYMARNRVRTWRRHALAVPHWALFDFSFAVFNGFRVALFERQRWGKLKAIVLGTWDGLRGRFGPCPEHRKRAFDSRD